MLKARTQGGGSQNKYIFDCSSGVLNTFIGATYPSAKSIITIVNALFAGKGMQLHSKNSKFLKRNHEMG